MSCEGEHGHCKHGVEECDEREEPPGSRGEGRGSTISGRRKESSNLSQKDTVELPKGHI